ncbi:putative ATPase/DNA-binding SARP family transcriptional activator [Streptacidiphilus sp. MAP12-16]|uniref:AfsR/SARP family transcriptional regulator n=1 Tax=Streptacidiphilus sp. MAP12-16 TaxID=3156300 RepID=UPI003514A276
MRIQLLGPLLVTDADGRPVDLGGIRLRVLLAALALDADHPVSATSLTDTLWPDDRPANPANALQALVSRLRAALGRDQVAATPAGYRLVLDPAEVDVHRFTRLVRPSPSHTTPHQPTLQPRVVQQRIVQQTTAQQLADALALWRGPALADVPGFPEAAARLEALRENAREDLLEARLTAGQGPDLLGELQSLTAAAPLRERPRALLMRALHQAGRTTEALAVFEAGRVLVADELGADPSPLLRDAHLAVLTTDAPPRPPADAPATPAPAHPALPAPLTSFLGREADLAAVHSALDTSRLVTLTGPGGTGKTRLALEAAAASALPQVRLVELASVSNPADIPSVVLTTLQLRESAATQRPSTVPHPVAETSDRIVAALGNRLLLLVLDNCEHLVDAAAALTARLLADCPGLRVLATSREPLGITGEQLHPVPPLGFPADPHDDELLSLDQALAFPAVRLFADRAAAVRPGYNPGPEDLPAVVRICRALDGQPLAIELAAARLRTLDPAQIDQRLARRFHLLTGGSRVALPRHRTLRAVVDWSWDLLEKPERTLLAQMSVFAGGADLETVEQVCPTTGLPADDVLDTLSSLVDKSLVSRTPGGRYRLLETIRAYAAEKLDGRGATAATRDAHAAHFLSFAERGEPHLYVTGQVAWIARFLADHDNLIAALRWSVQQGDAETAQRLVAALGWYLWRRGERGENLPLIHQALALPAEDVPLLARAVAHGITALYSLDTTWDLVWTHGLLRTALALRDALGDSLGHRMLRMLDIMSALFEQKDWHIEALANELFDDPDPWVRAVSRMFMGYSLQNTGRADEAEQYLRDAAERFREVGDLWGRSFATAGLADYAQWRGDVDEAVRLWELAIDYERQLGVHADSGDYRARLLTVRTSGATITAAAIAELEAETATASREGTWSVVIATHCALAEAYRRAGTPELGRPLLQRATQLVGTTTGGAPQVKALLAGSMGYIETACGDLAAASVQHHLALTAAVAAYDGPIIAYCLQGWADLMLRQDEPARAAELLGAAHTQRGMPDLSSADVARIAAAATEALGKTGYAEAYERGRTTPKEQVLSSLGVAPAAVPPADARP